MFSDLAAGSRRHLLVDRRAIGGAPINAERHALGLFEEDRRQLGVKPVVLARRPSDVERAAVKFECVHVAIRSHRSTTVIPPQRRLRTATMASLTDHEFLGAVATGEEPDGHLSNLRYAWILTSQHAVEEAERLALVAIDRRAHRCGGIAQRELTRAWIRVVADAVGNSPAAADFDEFLWAHPQLLERSLKISA